MERPCVVYNIGAKTNRIANSESLSLEHPRLSRSRLIDAKTSAMESKI